MTLSTWLLICTAAYGVHVLEEFMLNWRDWARAVIKLQVEWADFYIVNSLVVVLGFAAAGFVNEVPWLGLGFPALMIINAVIFHVVPVIRTRGRYSPGVATAVVLLFPVGVATLVAASRAGVLDLGTLVAAFVVGALLMASPIVLISNRNKPYFRQDHP